MRAIRITVCLTALSVLTGAAVALALFALAYTALWLAALLRGLDGAAWTPPM